MNKRRREVLRASIGLLSQAVNHVESVKDGEQDAIANYPENLQNTARYSEMEDVVDNLEEAIFHIEEAKRHIDDSI